MTIATKAIKDWTVTDALKFQRRLHRKLVKVNELTFGDIVLITRFLTASPIEFNQLFKVEDLDRLEFLIRLDK